MKQSQQWCAIALATVAGLAMANSLRAQTVVLSDFHNFNLSVTYANWNEDGSQPINGGSGFTPIITSGPTNYRIVAQGYGSGAYNFPTPIDATGATGFEITFTLNHTMQSGGGGGLWFGPNIDISDGTHMVHLLAQNAGGGYLAYGPYIGPGTYTLYGNLNDGLGGAPLDVSNITAFNLELDPAEYGGGAPYDITYHSFVLTGVPEPTTFTLVGLGLAGLLIARRQKK